MSNSFFRFKQFIIHQDKCAMKVTTDACLFGAWAANITGGQESIADSKQLSIKNILDIGCGTGVLSLMLAQKTDADIDAIEIDDEAAAQAMENEEACSFRNSLKVINDDARNYRFGKKYDVIISNPPFYENELKSLSSKKNTAHHSKELVLDDLLTIIKQNLSNPGVFFLLLPFKREDEIKALIDEAGMKLLKLILVRQSVNHHYFRIMLMGKINDDEYSETEFDELSIWDQRQQYTEEFTRLLRDYYLYL
jgi:tRNA1Val (adenine37-N6)-methyltransferase